MTNDFERAPFSGNWPRRQLIASHPSNGLGQFIGAVKVGIQQGLHAGHGDSPSRFESKCASFLNNKAQMMVYVGDFNLQHFLDVYAAAFVMNAYPRQGMRFQAANDLRQLTACSFAEIQFVEYFATVILQSCRKERFVVADEQGFFFRDDPFDTVRPGLIGVGQVAHDFENTPFARHGPSSQLLGR
jgi:hypothetical protein